MRMCYIFEYTSLSYGLYEQHVDMWAENIDLVFLSLSLFSPFWGSNRVKILKFTNDRGEEQCSINIWNISTSKAESNGNVAYLTTFSAFLPILFVASNFHFRLPRRSAVRYLVLTSRKRRPNHRIYSPNSHSLALHTIAEALRSTC